MRTRYLNTAGEELQLQIFTAPRGNTAVSISSSSDFPEAGAGYPVTLRWGSGAIAAPQPPPHRDAGPRSIPFSSQPVQLV